MGLPEIEQRIKLHNERQKVITSNIANADTPNYKAKDIDFDKALNKEKQQLAVTHENHVTNGQGQSGKIITKEEGAWKDGNNVELNDEIAKMTENQLMHNFYISRFASYVKNIDLILKS